MELAKPTSRRLTLASASAVAGGVAWLLAPSLPVGARHGVGSIEHLFLLMPLVVAPLALALAAGLEGERAPSPLLRLARSLQPGAAVALVLSFLLPSGVRAGVLTLPWLGFALALCASGAAQVARRRLAGLVAASLLAAQVFLVVGAAWLLLWRLGAGPRGFSPLMVSLAALHFHFSGFSVQVLVAATARRAETASTRLRALHRAAAIAALGGLPLLAAGKALASPVARVAGVAAMALALTGLSVTMAAIAMATRSAAARALLVIAAASGAAAAGLASAFGAGEFVHREWIGLETMLALHGPLMAFGFTLCGVAGLLRLSRA